MTPTPNISQRDTAHIWHPYTPMKLRPNALAIVRGEGALLFDEQGQSYIDAVSSWWVNLHGHAHPAIAESIYKQASTLAHCMFAGLTHEPAVELAERLLEVLPRNMCKVFYSDNGSCATEIAIKMALQAFHNQQQTRRTIVALEGSYHGDTFGAMATSARGLFTKPFNDKLFEVVFIPVPTRDNAQKSLDALTQILAQQEVAALIVEPLVQGAAGMQMHDAQALNALFKAAHAHGAYVIADEVMTGFGRTGTLFACDQLSESPDFICLSKGLTGGTLPLAITTCTQSVFDAFYSDDLTHAFYHGHSYTANPIACAAALTSLDLLLTPECEQQRASLARAHAHFAQRIDSHPRVENVRQCGTILALTIRTVAGNTYLSSERDRIYHYFLSRGILLRPIGSVLYLIPPYCITENQLKHVYECILDFLHHDSTADLAIV
ncbi:adenosylmethionine--8-amino-7-oxononanoate transaminase [Hydromonas duriensis]|uniref:Adenosylmethionine-8-amino-7-oxononanoate aminotransferase n=1 Tax=Hydromonas duriensis TaxID=1527608 RepID=A0A4R6Y980_9BURK|nr:adenosylmethionine--8-amino-7-oxononanoate transaminase [Hydromonas duriensis]TDR32011.1 adenosylmethionine-8-amino-7-oxononanoate aminotransferase [Hydromonas duriensis]